MLQQKARTGVDVVVTVVPGPKRSPVRRLKAGTAQKMVLNMITTASMVKLGKVREPDGRRAPNGAKLVERGKGSS
jgi:N-acetylmuramic acid 6-phosphate etherase